MKRILSIAVVLAVAALALYEAQRREHRDRVSANAVLDVAADLQRDVTRVPLQFTRLSDAEETRIGDALAEQYAGSQTERDAQALAMAAHVAEVGKRVAAHAKRPITYRFHLIADHDFINAFAIPGGHVFIGQGLIDQMDSEDELAFVLGHEIEHIDHFHPVERVQMEAQLRHLNLGALAAVAELPMALWQAGYSKDQEFEADREGVRLATIAGYAPQGALQIFERFQQLEKSYATRSATPADELSHVAVEGLEGYFRSHPEAAERLAQARRLIADEHLPADRPTSPLRIERSAKAAREHSR